MALTASLNTKKVKKAVFVGAMTAPAIIGFLVFYVYVNFDSIIMAFQVNDHGNLHFGLDNFKFFFNEISNPYSVFREAIANTAVFFLLGYVAMLGSFVVAYFIYKKVPGFRFFRFVFYLPCIIMSTATSSLFYYVTRGGGPVDLLYQQIFGKEMESLWNTPGIANVMLAVYTLFYGIGGNMVLFLGSMTNISPEIFDAGKIDGVGWFREMVQIVIPLIWSTLSVMILTSITGLTQASGPVFLFTKGKYGTYTINYWLYAQLLAGVNLEISAAVGWCCTAVTFPVALLTRKLLDKIDEKVGV